MYDVHPSNDKDHMADTSFIGVECVKGGCCCPM